MHEPRCALTESTQKALAGLQTPAKDTEVAVLVRLPVYRVRSNLRELAGVGLVAEADGLYSLTEAGRAKL